MEPARTNAVNPEIVDSLGRIELDLESESVQATYDSARDSTSLAVVAVVATALGEDPQILTPLQSVVDTDSLDELVSESPTGTGAFDSLSFRYEGFEITVTTEGVIEATPIGNA